jgi:predicted metal-dependent peptidase
MPGDSMTKADIAGKIIAAAEATKNKGNLPGGIERWLKELRDSQVDWRQIFQNFIGTVMSKTEYNWYPCNRRFIADGFCLPSLYDKKIGQIVVAFDTSGSIGQRELNQFITELKTIQRFVSEIICISCDAEVHTVVSLSDVDSVKKFVPKGGGGTDFRPVFNYIQKKNINPEVLIYITDGFGTYPERAPFYPVLWVLTPNHENPPETLGWRVVMNGLKDE